MPPTLMDAGSDKDGPEVTKSRGAVLGTATKAGTDMVGHATTDAVVEHTNRETTTLAITFDKKGLVSTYHVK